MKEGKRIVKNIARSFGVDEEILFLNLLYFQNNKFAYLKNPYNPVKNRDVFVVRSIAKQLRGRDLLTQKSTKVSLNIQRIYKDYDFSFGKPITTGQYLEKDDILRIHEELARDFSAFSDPISPAGIKDENLLESALFHPQTSFEGNLKYPSVETAGAALVYGLSQNHCFHNGNKRTAIVSLLVFLDKYNISLTCDEDEIFNQSLKLADHKLVEEAYLCSDAEIHSMAYWIHNNSKQMVKGERAISIKKLRQILGYFGCVFIHDTIVRRFKKTFFGVLFPRNLSIKIPSGLKGRDGDEVSKSLLKTIRQGLELDSSHGIDSDIFYTAGAFPASEFIDKYKNLLRRLSKF